MGNREIVDRYNRIKHEYKDFDDNIRYIREVIDDLCYMMDKEYNEEKDEDILSLINGDIEDENKVLKLLETRLNILQRQNMILKDAKILTSANMLRDLPHDIYMDIKRNSRS